MDPMIVVLGAACSGTSAVSGVLHHLGVYMASGKPASALREIPDTWEDMQLNTLMKRAFTMPTTRLPYSEPKMNADCLRAELLRWGERHRGAAHAAGRIPGAKFPHLCLVVDLLNEVWGPILTVAVDRPIEKVTASLVRHGWLDNEQVALESTKQLVDARDHALNNKPTVRIDFDALQATPEIVVRRLAEELGIEADEHQVAAAVKSVAKLDDPRFSSRNAAVKHSTVNRLRAEVEANPSDTQRIFQLAEIYFELGDFVNAARYYTSVRDTFKEDPEQRFEDPEQMFCVVYHFAVSLDKLNVVWQLAEQSYKLAFMIRPTRAEPLYAMAQHYAEEGNFGLAHQLARIAASIPFPEGDTLGVIGDIYQGRASNLMALCALRGSAQP